MRVVDDSPDSLNATPLRKLLDDSLLFDATTDRGLTNHLPMALIAKAGLGAAPRELARFARRYARRLVKPGTPRETLSRSNWQSAIGESAAYPELVHFFDGEVTELGIDESVRTYLNDLVPGISGAAFHGVIRLAYALDVELWSQVSSALAYLASSASTLAPLDDIAPTSESPQEILDALSASGEWSAVPSMKLISEEMSWVSAQRGFARLASSLEVNETTPRQLADAALKVYASTDDFTALHGVTGMEALARVRKFVADPDLFDRFSFQALAAAYATMGAPALWSDDRLAETVSRHALEPRNVAQRAAWSDDEHVAKLVFTARRLDEEQLNPLYSFVSARAVMNEPARDAAADMDA